jgi:hypothetical protein
MAVRSLSIVRSLLVLANWVCFIAVFIWTSTVQGRADWWLNLNWGTWLTDLQSTVYLREVAVGSVWIVWLLISVLISLIWMAEKAQSRKQQEQTDLAAAQAEEQAMQEFNHEEENPTLSESSEPEVVDEVRQKILKLQESLKQI